MEGFTNEMSLNWVEDFGFGPIHNDPFGGRKIACTSLNKLGAMGDLVNREKMEKWFSHLLMGALYIFTKLVAANLVEESAEL